MDNNVNLVLLSRVEELVEENKKLKSQLELFTKHIYFMNDEMGNTAHLLIEDEQEVKQVMELVEYGK